jgi:hypothetical protein
MTVEERIAKHVCCFCEGKLEHYRGQDPETWGHNPDNACSIEKARCCSRCNSLIVMPVRIYTMEIITEVLKQ